METLYDITKRLGKGQGEDMMWSTLRIVSDAVEYGMSDKDKDALMSKIFGMLSDGHFDEDHATDTVTRMYYADKDGAKHYAPFWTIPQVMDFYETYKDDIPASYNEWDFYVTMNMQKADQCLLFQKWWPDATHEDLDEKYAESAAIWLADEDNPYGSKKIWAYLHGGK